LRFLSTVNTAKIPLYLAAGPSLDVWTTCPATEEWFGSILLSKAATTDDALEDTPGSGWWNLARSQSPIGILVQVVNLSADARKPRLKEILFYGTIAPSTTAGLPTPPSSSPDLHVVQGVRLPELKVHAIPLSSDLLYQQAVLPASPTLSARVEPQFLQPQLEAQATPGSPKRKRDIFEEATISSKKARGKGGAGIAAAAARGTESQPPLGHRQFLSIDTKTSPFPDSRPPSANSALSRPGSRQLSRSPSISSDVRPSSRKGLDAHSKRSNLSYVATVPLQPEEATTESRNKEALSKVVMAAMRMYGLQQRKKNRSRRASMAPGMEDSQQFNDEVTVEDAAKDEEYKLVYHQTYKGAAFALRKHIAEKPLHSQPDRLRDVVEKLLAIFLNDPLAQPLPTDEASNLATPGSKQHLGVPGTTISHTSPFDQPSVKRPGMFRSKTDSQVYTGSPVSRRKVVDAEPAPT
jgi:hypothetical protein